jgi:hypothetical protein
MIFLISFGNALEQNRILRLGNMVGINEDEVEYDDGLATTFFPSQKSDCQGSRTFYPASEGGHFVRINHRFL